MSATMRGIIIFLLAVALGPPALAQDDLTAVVYEFDDGSAARLTLALSSCPENPECDAVTMTCGSRRHFGLEMGGFSDDEIASWLRSNGAVLILRNGHNSLPLAPLIIEFNENAGEGWFVRFIDWDGDMAKTWLMAINYQDGFTIRTIQGDLSFPGKVGDLAAIRSFVDFCLRAGF